MKTRLISQFAAVSAGLLIAGSVLAKPNTTRVQATNNKSGVSVTIPLHAVEVAPNVFSLGTAQHNGKTVEGLMFVYRSNAKPDNPGGGNGGGKGNGGGGGGDDPASSCYSHLAKGAKWKTAENWIINPSNNSGLSDAFLLSTTSAAYDEWEAVSSANIVGDGSIVNTPLVADESSPDGLNEIYFGEISDPGVIAVTITWGIFGGPPRNRELVEMDQVYNQVDFAWSGSGEAGKMDYENIAQHEIGHAIGMGHAPTAAECVEETMYPTASNGETSKRDLGVGDTAGIKALY